MKKVFFLISIIVFVLEIFMLFFFSNKKMWEGKIECISPNNKYILTITSNHTNVFDAPYCIRIADYGSPENLSYDFYIYECCEEPVVEWTAEHVFIKCLDLKGEEIGYEIEVEGKDHEK